MRTLLVSILALAFTAFAADINGNWKATAEGPNGSMERTFVFKVDGAKLTGETTSQMAGKSTITDGTVDGDNLTFTITANIQGNELKINYKGKVTGDEIHLTSQVAGSDGGQTFEWNGKRVK